MAAACCKPGNRRPVSGQRQLTASTLWRYASGMDPASREAAAQQLAVLCRDMVTRLRDLAARLEGLAPPDAYDIMTWLRPQVGRLLAESERVLGAIDAKT